MKKKDLESGMWAQSRNGQMYMVIKNSEFEIFAGRMEFMNLSSFNDNLVIIKNDHPAYRGLDIVKVFKPTNLAFVVDGARLELICEINKYGYVDE